MKGACFSKRQLQVFWETSWFEHLYRLYNDFFGYFFPVHLSKLSQLLSKENLGNSEAVWKTSVAKLLQFTGKCFWYILMAAGELLAVFREVNDLRYFIQSRSCIHLMKISNIFMFHYC